MATAKKPKTKPNFLHHAYRLRVELAHIKPTIWRMVWVDSAMSLHQLHHILQAAMGWTDAHLHQFTIDGKRYGVPSPEDLWEPPLIDERKTKLGKLLKPKLRFSYWYDFGDDWMHQILVEEVQGIEEPYGAAEVVGGENACPPEDCGGPHSYQQFLEDLQTQPDCTEVQEFLHWAGEDFDPTRFDRFASNAALLRMAWNGWGK